MNTGVCPREQVLGEEGEVGSPHTQKQRGLKTEKGDHVTAERSWKGKTASFEREHLAHSRLDQRGCDYGVRGKAGDANRPYQH